jgi:hypothetical protein
MTIEGGWTDATQRNYCLRTKEGWTWEAYQTAIDTAVSAIQAVESPVAMIFDMSHGQGFPGGDILGNIRYLEDHIPPNVFASIVVGGPYIITAFTNVYIKLRPNAKQRVRFAKTIEEATAIAEQRFEQITGNAAE